MNPVDYRNFSIAHRLTRRLRIVAPALRRDPERIHVLAILLNKREGITKVKVVPDIASVTIHFDPKLLPADNLLRLLDSVIDNLGRKPRAGIRAIRRKNRHPRKSQQNVLLGIGGMSCSSCSLYLEMLLQRHPDVVKANVNYLAETAHIQSYLSREELCDLIAANGYQAYAIDSLSERKLALQLEQRHLRQARDQLKALAVFSVPVALLGLLNLRSRPLLLVQALLTAPVVFVGGRDIFNKAWNHAKQGSANMDSLIALGVAATYVYSLPALLRPQRHVYFGAATAIIDFVKLGRYLEEVAKNKMVRDIRRLVDLQPQQSTLLRNGNEEMVSADRIAVGDIVLIRSGERIPVDGIVVKGLSGVDETSVTGSSVPSIKESGHRVFDGSLNLSGALQVRATAIGKDTLLSGLIHMVDQAQASKLTMQTTADRFAALFVPGIVGLSFATFSGWLLKGASTGHALANAIAVLLISCPCALGLAGPAATMVGSGRAARRGIYIRNGEALETAAAIDLVIFDKTGTLTQGDASITDLFNVSDFNDDRLVQLAASAEFNSAHYIGRAVVRRAKQAHIELLESSRFHSMPDQGIRAEVAGHQILLGNRSWMQKHQVAIDTLRATAEKLGQQGKTVTYLAVDRQAAALFGLTDPLRTDAERVVQMLQDQGIETLMVTGDSEAVAKTIAGQVGIATWHAEADPAKKLYLIRELQRQGRRVAMVGDGINDAPALAAADLSLAIGHGADIAIASSDLILHNAEIGRVEDAIALSRETLGNIRQNLFWAFTYNAVAIPFAVAGKLTPTIASAAMALSSVSIVANSLRLNKK
ncbi:heavy metal translocating P-type ATPase [Methylomarinum vadi]|uniref:heavy metal translocating P-type ATPase n=1 Tax=Methylomarinum vadi TaxID=438855 RepID=UPI0004DF54BD|nr:heavy metal translocating P-type ATPase [Methylomarinum vadi]